VQHVIDLYRKQNGRCALSGIVLTWNEQPNHFTNISIDRIDSDQGYEIGNVRLIAVWVNNALANFSEETMWMFVQSLASKMQSKRTVSTNEQASSSYPNHTLGTRDGLSRIVHWKINVNYELLLTVSPDWFRWNKNFSDAAYLFRKKSQDHNLNTKNTKSIFLFCNK
jgi:hypothetical protein